MALWESKIYNAYIHLRLSDLCHFYIERITVFETPDE